MRILIAIVHYWDPEGGGNHQSLRPDYRPRLEALQNQLLCLRRLGSYQSLLHMADRAVYRTNENYQNTIDVKIVTDGVHNVFDYIDPIFLDCFDKVVVDPLSPKHLGFEAHHVLEGHLSEEYDLYGYLEDDLLIHDSTFFNKILWFAQFMGADNVLLPQRLEYSSVPSVVDRFYIDGPIAERDLRKLVPNPGPVRLVEFSGLSVPFAPPVNPHAGCFFLTHVQLLHWRDQPWWLDRDVSFISPLESAATLGIAKSFQLFKPCFSHAGWLEIEHSGTSFHCLIN